jgi:hypothetical protein
MTAISPRIPVPARTNRIASIAAQAAAETQAQAETPERPNFVSIYASTIFAVAMVFLLGVGLPTAFVYGNATGWGLGAFCAFWGGPSFGVMAASARVSAWYEKHDMEF